MQMSTEQEACSCWRGTIPGRGSYVGTPPGEIFPCALLIWPLPQSFQMVVTFVSQQGFYEDMPCMTTGIWMNSRLLSTLTNSSIIRKIMEKELEYSKMMNHMVLFHMT